MAEIKSSSGMRGTYTPASTENRHFIVDDATSGAQQAVNGGMVMPQQQVNAAVFNAQQQPPIQVQKTKSKNSLLERLILLGKGEKEVDIDGLKFVLTTLTNKDNTEITKEIYQTAETVDFTLIRTVTLAQAIKSIDGISLDDFEMDEEYSTAFQKRKAIVEQMQLSVINKIMSEYDKLQKEIENSTTNEEIKK